jgi:plasmid stabilization system protein ParE
MKNTYSVFWSSEALKNMESIFLYLEENWTQRELKKFAKLLDKQIKLIQSNPLLFGKSDKSNDVRRSVLNKQITIYYRVRFSEIQILTLFDNRQDPEKLNFD